MIIFSPFIQFHNFAFSQYLKFYNIILDSFEFCKFQAHNEKTMAKDKKVNIAVTHSSPIKVRTHRRCGPAILPSDAISIENFLSPRN